MHIVGFMTCTFIFIRCNVACSEVKVLGQVVYGRNCGNLKIIQEIPMLSAPRLHFLRYFVLVKKGKTVS